MSVLPNVSKFFSSKYSQFGERSQISKGVRLQGAQQVVVEGPNSQSCGIDRQGDTIPTGSRITLNDLEVSLRAGDE